MKKITEAVFRSPKWMRRFADFELRTAKDLNPDKEDEPLVESATQEEIGQEEEEELYYLYNKLVVDFDSHPYKDKISLGNRGVNRFLLYLFEDGSTLEIHSYDNIIVHTDSNGHGSQYDLDLSWKYKFASFIQRVLRTGKDRPSSSSTRSTQTSTTRDKYDLLNDKIKLRQEQLSKMRSSDPNRQSLQNELDTYRRIRDKMKAAYKFENLKSFDLF